MEITTDLKRQYGVGYSEVASQLMLDLTQPIYNNDAMLENYYEMSEMDETVGTGLEFLCFSVVRKMQSFTHENKKIQELVEQCVNNLQGTVEDMRKGVLMNAMIYGFGVGEFSLFPLKSQWILSALQVYDSRALSFVMEKKSNNSIGLKYVHQNLGFDQIFIPAEKCWVYRFNAITNPYGKSRLKRCWKWYSFKKAIPKLWAIALERYGMPALVGKSTDTDAMMSMLSQLYSNAYAAILPDDEISVLEKPNGTGLGDAYERAASFCNKMIYRSLFLPSLLEAGEGGGSYSLGEVHWDMFDDACLWLAQELAEAEIEQLWRPIIEWNMGEQEDYGDIAVANTQSPEELKILSEIFSNGVNCGMLYPDEGDAEWMREKMHFPREIELGGEPIPWRKALQQREEKEEQRIEKESMLKQSGKASSARPESKEK